jgi:hypothetical protein
MLVAYTWSKMLDDFSSVAGFLGQQNPGFSNNNKRYLDKSLSSLDVGHRIAVNYQWDLPLGKGRQWLNSGGISNVILGGWALNGIVSAQSGLPISIDALANTTNSFGGVQRPNSTGISSKTPGTPKERINDYFNNAAFADVPRFTFGNVGRFLPVNRGPYLHVWDLSVIKNIPIRESKRLEFRAEFFNLFNQTNLLPPSGNSTVFGRPQFGSLTGAESPRIIQFGLKFHY